MNLVGRTPRLLAVVLIGMGTALAGCSSGPPLHTVVQVDLPRFMGDWYVIANIPYLGERNCFDSIESYAPRSDGRMDNWFQCRKKSFDAPLERQATASAEVTDHATNATWRVTFFKVIRVGYFIVDLDADYQWVAVAHPSRRYGWIMARSKTLAEPLYQTILQRLGAQGYDTAKFQKVPQRPTAVPGIGAGAGAG